MNTSQLIRQIRVNSPRPATADQPDGVDLILSLYWMLTERNRTLLERIAMLLIQRQEGKP